MEGSKTDADLYTVLGVQKTCSASEVRNAYKRLAMKWHPDKCSAGDLALAEANIKFQAIHEAYMVLSDDNKRWWYDAGLYEADETVENADYGMNDFLQELAELTRKTQSQRSRCVSLGELRDLFMDIFDGDTVNQVRDQKPSSSDHSSSKRTLQEEHFYHTAELASFQAAGFCVGSSGASSSGLHKGKQKFTRKHKSGNLEADAG